MMAYLYLFIIFLYNSDGVPLVMRVIIREFIEKNSFNKTRSFNLKIWPIEIIFLGLFIHLGSLM